ncbi:AraC family transcriptional regulator [Chitinophaga silvatica]|uniref:AraC family transcriptional regulator n=1 Tax=Chitinophaga silvatica TaxID=2282649 RepID=A0A3E1Y5T7_9BACT|nr:AraC family transcriptional regulator [Chitinophaga silvatica]RFS20103.1 AraC family transcriptional regulator [Chitinophaga silvatica]
MEKKEGYNSYRIAVPPAFEEIFSHFYFAENKSDTAITQTLLPSYQTIMVFSFGTQVSFTIPENAELTINKCLVLGPIKQALDYTLPPNAEILVANFKDDAFFRFFGNASIMQNTPIHPDELLNENCFTHLWSELNKIVENTDRINHILDFSKPYVRNRNQIAEQIIGFDDNNNSPVKDISEKNQLSERAIQLHHKKYFGYSAKEINRFNRFLKAIQLIQETASSIDTKIDWFEVIHICGYYDQSQLIHDFKHYLNLSPSKYLKYQQSICNPRS